MRLLHALRPLRSHQGGATAVEFALIGPLFLLLVMACIEFGIQLMTQLDLDNATEAIARQVAIGQVASLDDFKTQVCAKASVLLSNCSSVLQVNVASSGSFAALSPATVSSSGTLSASGFAPGSAGASVLVQAAFTRPYDVQWLTTLFGAKPTLLSTVAIQNEPAAS